MRVLLMYPDRDFDPEQLLLQSLIRRFRREEPQSPISPHDQSLIQDLELDTLMGTMAGDDEFLFTVAREALLSGLRNSVGTILYRQQVLRDCIKNPDVVSEIYSLSVRTVEEARRHWWGLSSQYPSSLLHSSIELLEFLLKRLKELRECAEEHAHQFTSDGFSTLFALLVRELNDEYLARAHEHIADSKFRKGVMLSAELGEWNESTKLVLRKPSYGNENWLGRLFGKRPPGYTFYLADRDEAGGRILSDMRSRGITRVAIALGQSADHVLSFFKMLQTELAFYIGCLNLHNRLTGKTEPLCFPVPASTGSRRHRFSGLYDLCLSLQMKDRVVGNSLNADGKNLVIITGANQGGKSTFLRSIGLAQLMMQCGMFVGAEAFEAEICPALFTHYKREEDPTMKSGKFDEELARMSEIADKVTPNSMLLFNESFAATNDREGSEIARQIVSALVEKRIKVFYVTHLYEFARGFCEMKRDDALFLRAERKPDGTRTFKVIEGKPLETSYGEDLYAQIVELPITESR